jgi:hypothetical protein
VAIGGQLMRTTIVLYAADHNYSRLDGESAGIGLCTRSAPLATLLIQALTEHHSSGRNLSDAVYFCSPNGRSVSVCTPAFKG